MILVDNNSLDGENLESLDRVIVSRYKHPAKVILHRIKNWVLNLIRPKAVYGVNRSGNCLDDSHLYRSDCEACTQPKLNQKIVKDLIKNVKPFWKKTNRVLINGFNISTGLEPTRFSEDDEATKSFFDEEFITFEREYNPKKGKQIRDLE